MKADRLALIGIVLGLAGASLLALFLVRGQGEAAEETATVLVAGVDGVAPNTGAEALPALLEPREVPLDLVPQNALAAAEDVTGQRAVRRIGPGEILTRDQFGAAGPSAGGVIVEEGWEALTVEAAPAPGLEGYATPGSLVNLYWTATPTAGATPAQAQQVAAPVAEPFTQLVMAHTEVLAVTRGTLTGEAQQVREGQGGPTGVFLLKVRPEDVPGLVHAEQHGELWFTLANEDDPTPDVRRVTASDLSPAAVAESVTAARAQLEADRAEEEAEAEAAAAGAAAPETAAAGTSAEGDGR